MPRRPPLRGRHRLGLHRRRLLDPGLLPRPGRGDPVRREPGPETGVPRDRRSPAGDPEVPAVACSATYTVQNRWTTGFTAQVSVRNTGTAPLKGWTLRRTYAAGERVTQAWNATVTQSAAEVTASPLSHNAAIPAGGSAVFGFNGAWSGAHPPPAAGIRCDATAS
ncbi:cellulose-binding domain-containing protein [Streptomyces lateritius]|uniref:Cellulose-binding domain-containing protein n=1 Tax=Streptomyces lateritius TaxID=67313 RepID=A0ABW6YE88_9ACTN